MTRRARPTIALSLLIACSGALARAQDQAPAKAEALLIGQPKADYAARRKLLMERVAKSATGNPSLILVRGEDNRQKEDFEEGRFRQKNDFAYLTGVEVPGAALMMDPAKGEATLYLPPKSGPSIFSAEVPNLGPGAGAGSHYGFAAVKPAANLAGDLIGALDGPEITLYTPSPNPRPGDDRPDAKFVRWLKEGSPRTPMRDLAPVVAEMRKAKSPAEIALLQRAIDVTGEANERIIGTIKPGLFEYQLEARVLDAFLDGGAMRPGFASIIGSGPNATIPHYFANDRRMEDGDLVVCDIGGEYQLYTADVTRTYPVNGKFTPRQRELYQLVLDAQAEAERHMQPGKTRLGEMTFFVSQYFRKSPLRAKDESGQEHTMDRFFIHGLSHYLGMDVHDVGSLSAPMQPGEVFTIEPGLYIKGENIGIRIEDDYLMTDKGPVKLSRGIASTPDEIEAKIAKARASRRD